jgi:hypothetical protein
VAIAAGRKGECASVELLSKLKGTRWLTWIAWIVTGALLYHMIGKDDFREEDTSLLLLLSPLILFALMILGALATVVLMLPAFAVLAVTREDGATVADFDFMSVATASCTLIVFLYVHWPK